MAYHLIALAVVAGLCHLARRRHDPLRRGQGPGMGLWAVLPSAYIVQHPVKSSDDFPPRQAPPGFSSQQPLEGVLKAAAERQGN